WVRGAGAGAGSAVAAVAVTAAMGLLRPSWSRVVRDRARRERWFVYVLVGGIPALIWVAFKVGALSYGGGFVIIPLMQGDAVHTYHWMTSGQFLNAVALGQVTPGPVVATVAAVGY